MSRIYIYVETKKCFIVLWGLFVHLCVLHFLLCYIIHIFSFSFLFYKPTTDYYILGFRCSAGLCAVLSSVSRHHLMACACCDERGDLFPLRHTPATCHVITFLGVRLADVLSCHNFDLLPRGSALILCSLRCCAPSLPAFLHSPLNRAYYHPSPFVVIYYCLHSVP